MLSLSSLAGYRYLLVPVALGLLVPTLAVPWMSINLLGSRSYTPPEIMAALVQPAAAKEEGRAGIDLSMLHERGTVLSASVASMALYSAAIAAMMAAIPYRARRQQLALAAGILAIAAGSLWMYAIEALKSGFAAAAQMTGGIIGEEFRGREGELASLFIVTGAGPYFALGAGAVAVAAGGCHYYFAGEKK